MSHGLKQIAVDARMIRHSGIGTALRGLLRAWTEKPPPFAVRLMGPADLLREYESAFEVVDYRASIYGLGTLLAPVPVGNAQIVLGMHYTSPLWPPKPLVCIVHDLIHITHPPKTGTGLYMRARLAMLRRRADYIITPSRHTKVQLQTLHGFPAHRVLTLPWGPGVVRDRISGIEEENRAPREIMNPVELSAPEQDRMRAMVALAEEIKPLVVQALRAVDQELGTESSCSFKKPENMLRKAHRPSILAEKPWFRVEHVRDSFRFKTVINDFEDPRHALAILLREIPGVRIVKIDTRKMLQPREWGWRFAAFDLRMPNGLLVEYYMPLKEQETAKREGNHALFEKWRNCNPSELEAAPQEKLNFVRDIRKSRDAYQAAWEEALRRLEFTEEAARALWKRESSSLLSITGDHSSLNSSAEGRSPGAFIRHSPPGDLRAVHSDVATKMSPEQSWRDAKINSVIEAPSDSDPARDKNAVNRESLDTKPYLLAVGIFKPHKNWPFLVERLAGLYRSGRLTIPLAAAGLGAKGGHALQALAQRYGIADRIKLIPLVDDEEMAALYRGSTALLFPSLAEGFGFPLLEAMKAGTPCVAANLPPMNEIAGQTAFYFDPDVPESFDRALLRVVNDRAARDESIALGRIIAARYSWQEFAIHLQDVLQRTFDESRPS